MICKKMHLLFFNKQPGYKELALKRQITQQVSRLNPFSLNHNKKIQIKEKWSFYFVINVKLLLNEQCTTIQLFQKRHCDFKILKSLIININFES